MRRHTWILLGALMLAAPRAALAQQTYVVAVGINDYLAWDDEVGGDLRGAENDALLVRDILIKRWGVPEQNVRTLLSRAATKDAIQEAVTGWLATVTRPGDLAVFYFAGHGTQAFDLDGDEPDGLDETIAPADIAKRTSERDIRDDELRKWLETVPADVVVILDSCHSGSATRGTGTMRPRVLDREIPPEVGFEPGPVRQRPDPESMADGSRRVLEIAAAAPNQSAVEGDFPTVEGGAVLGGAFTHHLVRELWRAPGTATYADVVGRVVASMKADQLTQDPQIEGPAERRLFAASAAKALVAPPAVLADPALGQALTLPEPALSVDVSYLPSDVAAALRAGLSGLDAVALADATAVRPDLYLRVSEDGRSVEVLGRDGGLRRLVARGPAQATEIAGALAKERDLKRLAALASPASPFAVGLAHARGRSVVEPDEPLAFEVWTERAGYLTLLSVGADGAVRVLHPLPNSEEIRLEPARPVSIPGDGSGFTTAAGRGLGLVLAIVTPEPLGIPTLGQAPAWGPERNLFAEVRARLDSLRPRGAPWASTLLAYEVVDRAR